MIRVERLVWNKDNVAHIARHDVTPEEVEEACRGEFIVLDAHHGRLLLIGPTKSGKAIAVIIDPEPKEGVYFPVTARSADKRERRLYQEEMGVKL